MTTFRLDYRKKAASRKASLYDPRHFFSGEDPVFVQFFSAMRPELRKRNGKSHILRRGIGRMIRACRPHDERLLYLQIDSLPAALEDFGKHEGDDG